MTYIYERGEIKKIPIALIGIFVSFLEILPLLHEYVSIFFLDSIEVYKTIQVRASEIVLELDPVGREDNQKMILLPITLSASLLECDQKSLQVSVPEISCLYKKIHMRCLLS